MYSVFFHLHLMYAMRCMTISATILPSPICQGSKTAAQAIGGCHSCIFSGHTALTLLLAYFVAMALPHLAPWLVAYCVVASLAIVATRSHYTVDVLVAWIAAYALTGA